MDYKAIIFDLDGTVVETEHIWEQGLKELLANKNVVVTPERMQEIERCVTGLALPYCCRLLKDHFVLQDSVETLLKDYTNIVRERYKRGISFVRGFTDFHTKINSVYQLKSGIATSADDETLVWTKQHVPLEQYFGHHIYNLSHVNNRAKPDPALYTYAAQQLVVAPELCIAIEDSANGVAAAKAAGMLCIGINTAGRRHLLDKADVVVEGYREINVLQLLKKRNSLVICF